MLRRHPSSSLAVTVPLSFLLLGLSHLAIRGGQHMARLWDRACPAKSTCLLRVVKDVQAARLRWGGVGDWCGVGREMCCGGLYFYARPLIHVQDLEAFLIGCWLRQGYCRCLVGPEVPLWQLGMIPVEVVRLWL